VGLIGRELIRKGAGPKMDGSGLAVDKKRGEWGAGPKTEEV
jgi:hypothetical protein